VIYDIVNDMAQKYSEKICIKSEIKDITYRELSDYMSELASRMIKDGMAKGQKVLILLPNSIEYVVSFFAINLAGGVAVVIDTKLNDELYRIILDNSVKYIITNQNGRQKLDRIFDMHRDEQGFEEFNRLHTYLDDDLLEKNFIQPISNSRMKCDEDELDAPSVILYTSGSTGHPKGVLNSHRTLQNALKNYCETVAIHNEDILMAVTPFFHSYAFGSCMLAGISSGATLLIQDTFNPRRILRLITTEKATVFHGVPYMYNLISDQIRGTKLKPDSLRLCISAGSPLSEEVARDFYNLTGKVIHQEYGSSETGTMAINLSDDPEKNIKSVGKPLKNVSVGTEETEDGSTLQIKSWGRSVGYVGNEPFSEGWYDTGDIVTIDTEGYIYILGRKKRMISVAGLKVNPLEVEQYISKHPDIDSVMVKGCKDEDFGEIVEAYVVRKLVNLSEQDIILFCQGNLAAYKIPRVIHFVGSLPQSSTGKVVSKAE